MEWRITSESHSVAAEGLLNSLNQISAQYLSMLDSTITKLMGRQLRSVLYLYNYNYSQIWYMKCLTQFFIFQNRMLVSTISQRFKTIFCRIQAVKSEPIIRSRPQVGVNRSEKPSVAHTFSKTPRFTLGDSDTNSIKSSSTSSQTTAKRRELVPVREGSTEILVLPALLGCLT